MGRRLGRVFHALEPLSDADLGRTVTIRGEAHSVMQAVNRQIAHYANHVGQIVLLAKHLAGDRWESLTVPRNRSAEFNRRSQPAKQASGNQPVRRPPSHS